jgi:hypothetical protein
MFVPGTGARYTIRVNDYAMCATARAKAVGHELWRRRYRRDSLSSANAFPLPYSIRTMRSET